MFIRGEEWLASLTSAAGVVWAVNFATSTAAPPQALVMPEGPLEICAIGILIWLHAKWRRFDRRQQVSEFSHIC